MTATIAQIFGFLTSVPILIWIMAASFCAALVLGLAAHGRAALRPGPDVITSARLNIFLLLLNSQILPIFLWLIGHSSAFYADMGLPHVTPQMWAGVWPPLVVIAAILVWDFTNYWNHRVLHMNAFWGLHAVHHSDPAMNWTTAYRVHVGELVFMRLSEMLVLGWLGFPPWALAIAGVIASSHNKYVHCHLGWTHGPLEGWIASPNWHRWHHADTPEAMGKNLANLTPVWDRLFGTYYNPGPCTAPLGFQGGPDNRTVDNLLYPVVELARWARGALTRGRPGEAHLMPPQTASTGAGS